jgi:hypothetical protein
MKGELYKEEEGYYLFVNTVIFGTTRPLLNFDLVKHKLSLENCEEIERDVPKNDLDGWDVEIEQVLIQSSIDGEAIWEYKLDDDGCIILKKK